MLLEMEILCIIPARSGSKGIKNKNIIDFKGKPLMVWSIEHCKSSKYNMKCVVSTDSEEYRQIGLENGAEVPFLRPVDISDDISTDYEFIRHCIDWLEVNQNYIPDIIVQLRPTQPCRKIEDLDKCIELFIENRNNFDSLRTVIPIEKRPYKMYRIDEGVLTPVIREYENIKEPYNQCRQILPECYLHNGYIDIMNRSTVIAGSVTGQKILPYIMNSEDKIDIDYEKDLILK